MPPPVTPEVALRTFVQPNNPLSGPYQPQKTELIALLRWVLDALDALGAATGTDPTVIATLRRDLDAEIERSTAADDEFRAIADEMAAPPTLDFSRRSTVGTMPYVLRS